jgi:hypothetical protein
MTGTVQTAIPGLSKILNKHRDMCERSFDKIKAIFKEYDDRLDALEQRQPMNVVQGPLQVAVLAQNADVRQYPETGGRVRVEELPAGPVQEQLPEPVDRAFSAPHPERVEAPAAEQPRSDMMSATQQTQPQMEFPIEDTPVAMSQWRWEFSQARIGENAEIEKKLNYLNEQIKKIKTEMATMRQDERTFRAVAFPDKYLPGASLGPYINVFAGFADSQFSGPVAELLTRFVDDVAAENDYKQRTYSQHPEGEPPTPTILQIDTPLVLDQILQKYARFLERWEAAKQEYSSSSRPAMMGNWHEFVNDEQFAEIVAQFKLPHSISEMIRRV